MRKFFMCCLLFALCFVSACAAQKQASTVSTAADALQGADTLAFFVGTSPEGAVTAMADAGQQLTITVGKGYTSALDQPCRKAELRSSHGIQPLTVCKENNEWRRVPAIFSAEANRLP